MSMVAEGEIEPEEALRWGWYAAMAASTLWDLENWQVIGERLVHSARDAGLLVEQHLHLTGLGMVATWRGDFAAAASRIAEVDAIAEATGTRLARYAAVQLAGWRGREAEAAGLMEIEVRNASAAGQGFGTTWCQWVSAVLHNGLGRYEDALVEARSASEVLLPEMGLRANVRVELIEAASRTGQMRLAVDTLERLAEAASVGETDWGLGVLARSRALLSEGEAAEGAYREAIERLSRTRLRPELARAHLLYGEWLRRENRRVDARAQLRIGHELFVTIGMEAFAERTGRELLATGVHVRKRTVETRDELTAQERQVALLARDGMSNPEIGARLFLSQHTVAYHLRKVFSKLGISSRRELAAALPGSESELIPA
jgi:ATP/maltotriose-dependent transcriptional regulator MalT